MNNINRLAFKRMKWPVRALALFGCLWLSACASTEELYAEYDENACRVTLEQQPATATEPERIVVTELVSKESLPWEPAVYFDYKQDVLTSSEQVRLQMNLKVLEKYPELRLVVRGFTDEVGSSNYNRALAERRVNHVVDYLQASGVDGFRMEKMPVGEEMPFLQTRNETVFAINRRVEMMLMDSTGRPVKYSVYLGKGDIPRE